MFDQKLFAAMDTNEMMDTDGGFRLTLGVIDRNVDLNIVTSRNTVVDVIVQGGNALVNVVRTPLLSLFR